MSKTKTDDDILLDFIDASIDLIIMERRKSLLIPVFWILAFVGLISKNFAFNAASIGVMIPLVLFDWMTQFNFNRIKKKLIERGLINGKEIL